MTRYTIPETDVAFTLPDSLDELTLGQWLDMAEIKEMDGEPLLPYLDVLPYLKILVSNPDELDKVYSGDIILLYDKVKFITKIAELTSRKPPKTIAGIKPPTEINLCSIKQYNSVAEWVSELIEDGAEATEYLWYVPLLAVYLYPYIRNEQFTQLSHAEELIEEVRALQASQAVPLAAFFLRSTMQLKPSGRLCSVNVSPSQPMSRWRSICSLKWSFLWRNRRSTKSPTDDD